jgi:hypothetical protein
VTSKIFFKKWLIIAHYRSFFPACDVENIFLKNGSLSLIIAHFSRHEKSKIFFKKWLIIAHYRSFFPA